MVMLGAGRGPPIIEFLAPYFPDKETGAQKEEVNRKLEKWKRCSWFSEYPGQQDRHFHRIEFSF